MTKKKQNDKTPKQKFRRLRWFESHTWSVKLIFEGECGEGVKRCGLTAQDALAKSAERDTRLPCKNGFVFGKAALAADDNGGAGGGCIGQAGGERLCIVPLIAEERQICISDGIQHFPKIKQVTDCGDDAALALLCCFLGDAGKACSLPLPFILVRTLNAKFREEGYDLGCAKLNCLLDDGFKLIAFGHCLIERYFKGWLAFGTLGRFDCSRDLCWCDMGECCVIMHSLAVRHRQTVAASHTQRKCDVAGVLSLDDEAVIGIGLCRGQEKEWHKNHPLNVKSMAYQSLSHTSRSNL